MNDAQHHPLTSDMGANWAICKDLFEDKDSDRDFIIEGTTLEDWRKLFSLFKNHPEWKVGRHDGPVELPEITTSLFRENDPQSSNSYLIHLDQQIVSHVWLNAVRYIEMDLLTKYIVGPEPLSAVLDFMRQIGNTLQRTIKVTYDFCGTGGAFIEYDPTAGFSYQDGLVP